MALDPTDKRVVRPERHRSTVAAPPVETDPSLWDSEPILDLGCITTDAMLVTHQQLDRLEIELASANRAIALAL